MHENQRFVCTEERWKQTDNNNNKKEKNNKQTYLGTLFYVHAFRMQTAQKIIKKHRIFILWDKKKNQIHTKFMYKKGHFVDGLF